MSPSGNRRRHLWPHQNGFREADSPSRRCRVAAGAPDGYGEPRINDQDIRFNGVYHCGHPKNEEICVPYPTDDARGIGASSAAIAPVESLVVKLKHRCCAGRCSHDTFALPKIADRGMPEREDPEAKGLVFYWTKTAFKPYDFAVTAALIVAKRHLRNQLVIHSDGADPQWADAKELCHKHLGYGAWFGIVEDPRIELWPGPNGTEVEREVRVRILVEMDPLNFQL